MSDCLIRKRCTILSGVFVFALALAVTGTASAQRGGESSTDDSRAIAISPPPPFVVEQEPVMPTDATRPPTQGIRILLYDIQHDATADEPALYVRQVVEAAGFAGVTEASQATASFNPAYQRFEVNHIRVMRGESVEDRRDRAHLDMIRREQGLELQRLTGEITATLRLDDIRIGDVVDIAFTIYGVHSTFSNRDAKAFVLASTAPVERFALRTLWPEDAHWKVLGSGPTVEAVRRRDGLLLEVAPQPMGAMELEDFAPPWEPTIPLLMTSSFGDWADVSAWGHSLFEVTPDPDVTALAETIAAEHATKADQVVAALRFVQQEVRYLAVTLGNGGYVPASPSETLRSRTGECKAKTLLFLGLMNALGIDAHAAFVNTSVGRALPDLPASPTVFDHVIARVSLDGQSYWVDPTAVFQGGRLDVMQQPYFGYALPLERASGGIVAMNRPQLLTPTAITRETYDLSGGTTRPAHVHVEITKAGAEADFQRTISGIFSRSEIDESFLEGYKARYDSEASIVNSRYDDDINANVITTVYELLLHEPFSTTSDNELRRWFEVDAFTIMPLIYASNRPGRVWPVVIAGPAHQQHEIVLQLPDIGSWDLAEEEHTIENPAFRFRRWAEPSDLTHKVTFMLETLSETVAPDVLNAVLQDQERMLELGSFWIWYDARARAPLPPLTLPALDFNVAH